jgi:integrase
MRLPKVSKPFLQPGRSNYYCRFTLHGKQKTKPLDTSNYKEALAKAALLQAELIKAVTSPPPNSFPCKKEPTLKEVINCYLKVLEIRSSYHRNATANRLKAWLEYFGDIKAEDITIDKLIDWRKSRVKQSRAVPRKEHSFYKGARGKRYRLAPNGKRIYERHMKAVAALKVSDTTIHNDLAALRTAFRVAEDRGLIDTLPKWITSRTGKSLIPKATIVKREVIPMDHIALIKKACEISKPIDRLILLLLYSGLSLTDALRVTWDNIQDGVLFTSRNKTGEAVTVPLPESFLAASEGHKPNERIIGLDKATDALNRRLKAITGIEYGSRIFRRSLCSLLGSAGVNDATRQAIMGHASAAMTTLYTVSSLDDAKKAISKLAKVEDEDGKETSNESSNEGLQNHLK